MEESGGFHNIDELPLGKLLQIKQDGKATRDRKHKKHRKLVRKLIDKGFK